MTHGPVERCWSEFAGAIVMLGIYDWCTCNKALKKASTTSVGKIELKRDAERFILSDWFVMLSDCDGRDVMKRLIACDGNIDISNLGYAITEEQIHAKQRHIR